MIDLPIPGNDDGIRSIELIMSHMADAVLAGRKDLVVKNEGEESKASPSAAPATPAPAAEKESEATAE